MTAVTEPAGWTMTTLSVEARRREMRFRQELFDATRGACPTWCDGGCEEYGHVGDAILHFSAPEPLPVALDLAEEPIEGLGVRVWRHDSLTEPSSAGLEVVVPEAYRTAYDGMHFTAAQARQFAAALLHHADLIDTDFEVPAEQVHIGDWIQAADGPWIEVYMVCADEASGSVQISGSTDVEDWSDFDYRDENPEEFKLGEMVRVHRGGDPR